MSYQIGTEHYNLPQTQGTDKRDWFDTNEAFRNVDADLHNAVQGVATEGAQIEAIQTDVANVVDGLAQTDAKVAEIEGKQSTDEENIAQNAQAISTLTTEVHEGTKDLAEMIEVTEEASATAENAHAVGSYFRYNDNLWRTTVAIRVGDEIVPNVNCETTDVMSRIEALEGASPTPTTSEIDDSVTALDKTWSSSKISTDLGAKADATNLTNVANRVTTVEGNLTANNTTAGVSNVPFRFGVTDDGQFGYIIEEGGADTVIPFSSSSGGALNLVSQTFSDRYHVPTVQGDYYWISAHYGSNPSLRNYRTVQGFGDYAVVQATSTEFTGGPNGDDMNYGSWVTDCYHIEGDWKINGESILVEP